MAFRDMPESQRGASGFRDWIPGVQPPTVDGYTVALAEHSHPFSNTGGWVGVYFPSEPSQADLNYVTKYNMLGIVRSWRGDYYFGPGSGD